MNVFLTFFLFYLFILLFIYILCRITSPMAKEARNTLKKSRVQFDELVAFAEGEAEAEEDNSGGTHVSISDDANE